MLIPCNPIFSSTELKIICLTQLFDKLKRIKVSFFSEAHAFVFRLCFVLTHMNMDLADSTFTQMFHMYTESFN